MSRQSGLYRALASRHMKLHGVMFALFLLTPLTLDLPPASNYQTLGVLMPADFELQPLRHSLQRLQAS